MNGLLNMFPNQVFESLLRLLVFNNQQTHAMFGGEQSDMQTDLGHE